jgi:pSer/pThr/pTyr-binding forkhead associated (FHA) protein
MTFHPPEQDLAHHSESTVPSTDLPGTDLPTEVPAQPTPHAMHSGPRTELVVKRGPDAGVGYAVTQLLTTIGRHRDCDIVLDDGTVSRYHAELRRDHDRYVITDAGSLNGTYLNRRPVDHAELADGDELWIGKFRFVFRSIE